MCLNGHNNLHAVCSPVNVDSRTRNVITRSTRQEYRNTLEITRLAPAARGHRLDDAGARFRVPEAACGHGRVYPTRSNAISYLTRRTRAEWLTLGIAR